MRFRIGTTAGLSAMGHFLRARARWRRRVVGRAVLVAAAPLVAALAAEVVWGTSSLDWALGFFVGAGTGVLAWVWDTPPVPVENWRRGAEGERRTARGLRALERDGWHVRHDVLAKRGNRDHIVVGPGGVFLLDTKVLTGVVRVDGDVVAVDRLDSRGSYRLDRLSPALRAEAVRLKADLEARAHRTWVQAVVVIWAEFPQRVVEADRIAFVHGDELVAWLQGRPATRRDEWAAQLADAVRGLTAAA